MLHVVPFASDAAIFISFFHIFTHAVFLGIKTQALISRKPAAWVLFPLGLDSVSLMFNLYKVASVQGRVYFGYG